MPPVVDLVNFKMYPTDKLFDIVEAIEKELETRDKDRLHCSLCNSVTD